MITEDSVSPSIMPRHALDRPINRKAGEVAYQLNSTLENGGQIAERKPALPEIKKAKTQQGQRGHDFLPDEVLFALTQYPDPPSKIALPARETSLDISHTAPRKPPANVWNHKRREKLKHLTDQAVCFCGAGRDISFLYDLPYKPEETAKPERLAAKDVTAVRDNKSATKALEVPSSLVPEEYHIVKNKGVMGLEYYETDYTTQPEDHESHLVSFPSMKPTSRYEVLRLREVMGEMLEKAGVNDEILETVGPTQMHNLIELIKKEQKIYNIIFHELIRQTTVECSERGGLLADVRQRYADLLCKVPRQIKGLHEEVMAQRALDRRLTEELFRFKNHILTLTSELTEVKEHDKLVTDQAKKAQEELHSALQESQKNASLLGEYHELYELQRQRLEKLVTILTDEKELWSSATYSLSIKVIEEGNLITSRRAYIAEKAWSKLAHHFTVLLSDKDTEVLTRLQAHMERWRDLTESFHLRIKQMEEEVEKSLSRVKGQLQRWLSDFQKSCLNKDGAFVKVPDIEKTRAIFNEIKEWIVILQAETDKFSGNVLLTNNETLNEIEAEVQGWTDCGLEVFNRHKHGGEYPHDYKVMLKLNKTIRDMCHQYGNRVNGENGIARLIIQLSSDLESWENKLVNIVHTGQSLHSRDWMTFMENMEDWLLSLDRCIATLGTVDIEADQQAGKKSEFLDVHDTMRKAHMWSVTANNTIDSEDSKYIEQVTQMHTRMVRWMVNMLLRLAPNRPGTSPQTIQQALLHSPLPAELIAEAQLLFAQLDIFSLLVYHSTEDIVRTRTQERVASGDEFAEKELNDFQALKYEAYHWIYSACLMLTELTKEEFTYSARDNKFDFAQFSRARTAVSHILEFNEKMLQAAEKREEMSTTETPKPLSRRESLAPLQESDSLPAVISEGDGIEEVTRVYDAEEHLKDTQPPKEVDAIHSTQALPSRPGSSAAKQAGESQSASQVGRDHSRPVSRQAHSRPRSSESRSRSTSQRRAGSIKPPPDGQAPVPLEHQSHDVQYETIEVIGRDDNTRKAVLPEPDPNEPPPRPTSGRPMAVDSQKAYETMITVEKLQAQLLDTEMRAQAAEQRAAQSQAQLVESLERLRDMERQLADLRGEEQTVHAEEGAAHAAHASQTAPVETAESDPDKDKKGEAKKKGQKAAAAPPSSTKAPKKK